MNKVLITLLIGIFLMSGVLALDSLGIYKQNQNVRISQVCSDATYINISSITYPDSTIAVSNIEMTSSGSGEFYYNFNLTNTIGRYDVRGISDGCEKTFATYFKVDITNKENKTGETINTLGFLIIALIITMFLYMKISKLMSGIIMIGLGVGITYIGNNMGWVGIIIIITGLIVVVYEAFTVKKIKRRRF